LINKGINKESAYPYETKLGTCRHSASGDQIKLLSCGTLTSEAQMLDLISRNIPIAVSVGKNYFIANFNKLIIKT
jgi:hypothetical protein